MQVLRMISVVFALLCSTSVIAKPKCDLAEGSGLHFSSGLVLKKQGPGSSASYSSPTGVCLVSHMPPQ